MHESNLPRLYVIGDSISIQYGPHLARLLAGVFRYSRKEGEQEALLNLDKPQGTNGGDSSMVLDFLKGLQAAGTFRADVLMINCGLHDIKTDPQTGIRQVPLDRYQANLRDVVAVARGLAAHVIWVRTTPVDDEQHNERHFPGFRRHAEDLAQYNAAADRIMAGAGIPAIDLHGFTSRLGGADIYCDHVHFQEPVREKQAAFIAGWLGGWKRIAQAAN